MATSQEDEVRTPQFAVFPRPGAPNLIVFGFFLFPQCVICVNAKATMQTSPCGHRVVCRKCFVKTIQMAVSQRLLPLRCVICRAKILRLKQSSGHGGLSYSKSWLMPSSASSYSMSAKSWSAGSSKHYWNDKNWVPSSASQYSMTSRNVPNSASMYSMTSGSSSLSGEF